MNQVLFWPHLLPLFLLSMIPTVAEAVAPWKAVVFSSELGFPRVILEGDIRKEANEVAHIVAKNALAIFPFLG
jgi:hypothetical protein